MEKQATDELTPDKKTPPEERSSEPMSKKDQIISLFTGGVDNLEDIALMTNARISYVASVLQSAGLIHGYFDLYTTSAQPMNTYSRFFAGKLGFKDEEAANRSVELLNRLYRRFEIARDRAGQHHALLMGLTMFNRARWTGKAREAEIFRRWLLLYLNEPVTSVEPEAVTEPPPPEPLPAMGSAPLGEMPDQRAISGGP